MNYKKLKLTFGDKIRLLFLGIIPEEKLPVRVVFRDAQVITMDAEKPQQPPLVELSDEINTNEKEEEFHIPFFSDDEDVKTNF